MSFEVFIKMCSLNRGGWVKEKTCLYCSNTFVAINNRKYCNNGCRAIANNIRRWGTIGRKLSTKELRERGLSQ